MLNTRHSRLPKLNSIGYASGNFAKSLVSSTIDIVYLYFLVEFIGITPWLAGTILLVSLVWDGIADPVFGYIADRWLCKFLSYRQLIFIGTPLCALSFLLIFIVPLSASYHTLFWIMLSILIFRSCFALIDVPHNALLASLSLDSRERNSLSIFRFMFSTLGGFVLAFALAPILEKSAIETDIDTLLAFAFSIALMFVAVMYFSAFMSKSKTCDENRQLPHQNINVSKSLSDLWRNPKLRQILLICFLAAAFITVFSKMTIFYAKFVLGDASLTTNLISAHLLGQLLCLPFWHYLSTIMEKRFVAIFANALLIASTLLFIVVSPQSPEVAYLFFFMVGLSLSGLTTMNWSIVPDTIDYTQLYCGHRHEALTFGILLLVIKVANGLSIAAVGWSLDAVKTSSVISEELGVFLIMCIVPITGAIFSIFVLSRIKLSYREHEQLTATKLKQQR